MHAFLVNLDYSVRILVIIAFIIEPGVWQALKRALKSKKLEIQTFDPMYFFTTTGIKPEPINLIYAFKT